MNRDDQTKKFFPKSFLIEEFTAEVKKKKKKHYYWIYLHENCFKIYYLARHAY